MRRSLIIWEGAHFEGTVVTRMLSQIHQTQKTYPAASACLSRSLTHFDELTNCYGIVNDPCRRHFPPKFESEGTPSVQEVKDGGMKGDKWLGCSEEGEQVHTKQKEGANP